MHHAGDFEVLQDIENGFDIDPGGAQQFFAKRAAEFFHMVGDLQAEFFETDLSDQRIAVAVDTGRGNADDLVADLDFGTVNQFIAGGDTHYKAGDIIITFLVHSGHFGGLAADKGTV